ncbi:MAG: BrnT family toxin, partial [Myxococcaceae bacterium]
LRCSYIVGVSVPAFEWDETKSKANHRKHGVSFEEAQTVFADEFGLLIHDPDHSDQEDRFVILGLSSGLRTLVVCHCYRDEDDVIRIISARKADRRERALYSEGRQP